MIQQDTIRLLRECDSGIKMGISAIEDVCTDVNNAVLKKHLQRCRKAHEELKMEIQELLDKYNDEGKDPSPIAQGMSWVKTNVKLAMDESDGAIAELITDGCNMGIKSLNRYLNQYKAADEVSKDIAKRLINLEQQLILDIREFL